MKTTNKKIAEIIAGCVLACYFTTNLQAQLPPGLTNSGSGGTNVYNPYPYFNPTPVYTYPTNATLKWTLNFDSAVWCQSLTPDGNLIVPDLAYADYKFYSINPSLVDTNDSNYPAPDDFTNWLYQSYCYPGIIKPVVTADSNICVGGNFVVNTDNGATTLYDPNTYIYSNNIGIYDGICGLSVTNASLQWSFVKDSYKLFCDVCLGNDGTYYTSDGGYVYALTNAPGETNIIINSEGYHMFLQNIGMRWFYKDNGWPGGEYVNTFQNSTLVINKNALYVLNAYYGNLYAFNATNGTLQWYAPFGSAQYTTPVIGGGGMIYCTGWANLCAINPNSNATNGVMGFKWTYSDTNYQYQYYIYSPVIGVDETIYAEYLTHNQGSPYSSHLVAINPSTGKSIWNRLIGTNEVDFRKPGSLAVGSDGEIYLADTDGILYSFDLNGNMNWSYDTGSGVPLGSPLIAPDGTLYVSGGSYLYAFQIPTGIACSPWPEDFRNARRTSATATASTSNPLQTTNGLQITVSSYTNFPACVFSSSDLIHWDNLGQIILFGGSTNFVDIGYTNYPYRFYRAMPQ